MAADALRPLMPGAGHLVHMPSHIYQRVGRYADAVKTNQDAALSDEDYITQCRAQGFYPMAYYPHNVHFIWFAATMDGRGQLAIESARKLAGKVTDEALKELPAAGGLPRGAVLRAHALRPLGRDAGGARASRGQPLHDGHLALRPRARRSWARARSGTPRCPWPSSGGSPPTSAWSSRSSRPTSASSIMAVAPEVLAGEMAAARKDWDTAIAHLERAVRLEDSLVYTEPSEWHYPPRHALGAVLLAAGRAREAETVYWEDLKRNPENGWALFGLARAIEAQGRADQAALVRARFEKAWARADVKLAASRILAADD